MKIFNTGVPKSPSLSADAVLFTADDRVLLIKRKIKPFKDFWVLPGGHVEIGETVEEATKREIKEETGLDITTLDLLGVYSDPDRDPRGHTVSCAYVSKIGTIEDIVLNEEAYDFNFFKQGSLPDNIGFDHRNIIQDAFEVKQIIDK